MERDVENALLNLLTSGTPQLRERAAQGIFRIGSQRGTDIVQKIMARDGQDGEISRSVEDGLMELLKCGNGDARNRAAEWLVRIGTDRVESMLEGVVSAKGEQTPVGEAAADALARIMGSKVVFILSPMRPPLPVPSAQRQRNTVA